MGSYTVSSGVIHAPVKVVLYGPEGIGKSTFAAKFPSPVFIDTEGGTKKLNVNRLPQPTSWAMLMDEANEVRLGHIPCGTLVIDTADWAERLCIRAVCDRANVKGIEDFGYGKGYTYLKEEFGKPLDLLEDVLHAGHNVVMTAHAQLSKFEQPDEMGQYDRWTMKTSKQVAPLIREWCDMLLFANYKTIVVKDGDGKNAKNKAQGGRRVMYTTHHPCWDAKNRDGLADELAFDYAAIAQVIPVPGGASPKSTPPVQQFGTPVETPAPFAATPAAPPAANKPVDSAHKLEDQLAQAGVPDKLRPLMVSMNVTPDELQAVVGQRGYFPADMPVKDYPMDFVDGCLVAAWDQVAQMIVNNRDVPF